MNRMLSTAVGSAWKRASLSSPSVATAAAMAAAAILSAGSDDKGRDPKDLKKHLFEERASSWRNTQLCTCESLRVPSYGRRNTMLMLKSTSSKATLESRYNVSRQYLLMPHSSGLSSSVLVLHRLTGRILSEKEDLGQSTFARIETLGRNAPSRRYPSSLQMRMHSSERWTRCYA